MKSPQKCLSFCLLTLQPRDVFKTPFLIKELGGGGACAHLRPSEMRVLEITKGSDGKDSPCSSGDPGSISRSGRCPGEGNGNPLQYSGLENPTDRGAWWATVHRVAKNQTRLSNIHTRAHARTHTHTHTHTLTHSTIGTSPTLPSL